MRNFWRTFIPPRGRNTRRGLAQVCIVIGLVYLFASDGFSLYTQNYMRQAEIMPLRWFGVVFLIAAFLLRSTTQSRHQFLGRMVSAITSILFALFAYTIFPTGPTGVAMYGVVAFWAAGEAFHVSDGD